MAHNIDIEEAAEKFATIPRNININEQGVYQSGIRVGFKSGAKWAALQPMWISVEDRLPEIPPKFWDKEWELMVEPLMVDVIVCEGDYVHQCSYSKLRGFDTATDIPVTYWQPLPLPPKK